MNIGQTILSIIIILLFAVFVYAQARKVSFTYALSILGEIIRELFNKGE